jgi:regulator of sigma E protease
MSIIIFILVLIALIVVHEFGHFIVAKLSGMRVDEFGIGYPPRAFTYAKKGETIYTVNWLPFGGFVKIYGEDGDEEPGRDTKRAFANRPRILQSLVLFAGIGMNLLFAWILLSITLGMGTPQALSVEEAAKTPDAVLTVADVLPGSPAALAGLKPADAITEAHFGSESFTSYEPQVFTDFVAKDTAGEPITLTVRRPDGDGTKTLTLTAVPKTGTISGEPTRAALGVSIAPVGTLKVVWYKAPIDGALLTWGVTKEVGIGLIKFFGSIFTLSADLSQVSGPIGIAGAVGNASQQGIAALLSITALISVNLALINLLPLPALDGGRILFVIIEAITRRRIKPLIANIVNTAGFALLVLLMLVVTAHDVFKIFS